MDAGTAWRSAWVAAAVIALVLASPGAAHATHLSCGAMVSADTMLDSDLIDCPGNGVEITASDVTLDLGGHTIDGTRARGGSRDRLRHFTRDGRERDGARVPDDDQAGPRIRLPRARSRCTTATSACCCRRRGALVKRISASGIDGSAIHARHRVASRPCATTCSRTTSGMGGIGFADGRHCAQRRRGQRLLRLLLLRATGTVFDRNVRSAATARSASRSGRARPATSSRATTSPDSGIDGIALSEDAVTEHARAQPIRSETLTTASTSPLRARR